MPVDTHVPAVLLEILLPGQQEGHCMHNRLWLIPKECVVCRTVKRRWESLRRPAPRAYTKDARRMRGQWRVEGFSGCEVCSGSQATVSCLRHHLPLPYIYPYQLCPCATLTQYKEMRGEEHSRNAKEIHTRMPFYGTSYCTPPQNLHWVRGKVLNSVLACNSPV